jgi:TonB family protein
MTSGIVRLGVVVALVACVSILAAAQVPQRLRVGGDITRPQKIVHVDPVYPEKAKADRIEGMVIVEAVIATDGTVMDIEVIRNADPLLDAAAVEAVSQWEFTPTTLNGEPVELVMSVNVTFSLPRLAPARDDGAPPPPPPPPPS